MDLLDRIHRSSFLGPEFLTWLWCKSEELDGCFTLPKEKEPFELWFDDRLTVGSTLVDAQENIFRGGHPTSSPEAHMALRQGKMATEARLRVVRGPQEWSFVLKAEDLSLSALKIPAVLTKEDDERFYERMYLLEQLDRIVRGLYQVFLNERMGDQWESKHLPKIHDWMRAQGAYTSNRSPSASVRSTLEPESGSSVMENVLSDDLAPLDSGAPAQMSDGDLPPWENPILGEND